ncbi:MAG: hypothetical protein K6U12_11575 [Armatimonadetes bacterium]|jgi:hypothetical protein|nr:hypothetical protein [Armatimonadota bacterium]GIV13543.1 MAG: hypothetical protein KatS3mg021_1825 [Fimbriimonadales bacterium]CUU35368.1 hypothetical protein GXSOP10_1213 [Armatimonadetes bacterium GXS]CUU38258.1 hypothetical protein DCOP10_1244 [Armatimonadetes bacterium DC]
MGHQQLSLSESDIETIRQVIARRAPDLLPLVERLASFPLPSLALSDEEAHELSLVLYDEFVENGLEENYEPNEYGRKLDTIIGRVVFRG